MLEYKETKISELNPNPNNPRVNDEAADKLIAGLEHYGFINPVVVNQRDNMILAGHTRIKALKKMGKDSVPVLFVDMDETTARGFSLWDNKSAEFAQWDEALLKCELDVLSADGFDELLTGFDFEDEPEPEDFPDLPSGDKSPFQQMTFTLSDDQAETVKDAMKKAKEAGPFVSDNENGNGNALARIAEVFIG